MIQLIGSLNKLSKIFIIFILISSLVFQLSSGVFADCSLTSTNKIPISDLGTGEYLGYQGGLYPNGSNTRPQDYENEGVAISQSITPLNINGQPSQNGKIVMLSIGISNTKQEFAEFIKKTNLMKRDGFVNRKIVQINGAQGGQAIDVWADPYNIVWTNVDNLLIQKNLTESQVQVIWIKLAHNNPHLYGQFPAHVLLYKQRLQQVIINAKSRYTNAKVVYISSRTRAYTQNTEESPSPEPYSYEEGFGVKWLIEDKINGLLPDLPYLSWGSYLWIDGLNIRGDGKIWECLDVSQDDFTHPSNTGKIKVSDMLYDFFSSDTTTQSWFME